MSIVSNYIVENNLTDAHRYRLWILACNVFEEIQLDFGQETETIELPVEANKTALLPQHYMEWKKVGISNERGELIPLRHNFSLIKKNVLSEDRVDGLVIHHHSDTPDNFYFHNYKNGSGYVNLLGVPGGLEDFGSFAVDDVNGLIIFNRDFKYETVFLEFVPDPKMDENFLVSVQIKEAILAGMKWKDIKGMPVGRRSNISMIREARSEYYNQRRLARRRINPFRISDANEIIRLDNRVSIKS